MNFLKIKIKDFLARDYKKYNKQIVDLEKKIYSKNEEAKFNGQELKKDNIFQD